MYIYVFSFSKTTTQSKTSESGVYLDKQFPIIYMFIHII